MCLIDKLYRLLPKHDDQPGVLESTEVADDADANQTERLLLWNNLIETHSNQRTVGVCDIDDSQYDELPNLSNLLLVALLDVLDGPTSTFTQEALEEKSLAEEHKEEEDVIPLSIQITRVLTYWKEQRKEGEVEPTEIQILFLRTAQNFRRYCIQAFMMARNRRHSQDGALISHWSDSTDLLELYLQLMENQNTTRYASQLLFFATFPDPVAHYRSHLVEQCHLLPRLLTFLVRKRPHDDTSRIRVWLSLVRNVHNALAGYNCKSHVEEASISIEREEASEWVALEDDDNLGQTHLTFATAFRNLALFLVTQTDESLGPRNIQTELLLEILRCCYGLRVAARNIATDTQWHNLIKHLWQHDSPDIRMTNASILTDLPTATTDCSLLVDHIAPPAILIQLLQEASSTQTALRIVDDRAAAAVTPVLLVLHKYCGAQPAYCAAVRALVFPTPLAAASSQERPRNTQPLDAPVGTIRHAVIQLLTSPQGYIKRLAGEWLWLLCGENMNEFIRRVGMGNALPLLGGKGLVTLPSSVYQ